MIFRALGRDKLRA